MTQLQTVLRNARQQKGLSLRDIQKLSDNTITNTYINNIENGDIIPSPKKLRVLAIVLKLDFLELMLLAGHVRKADLEHAGITS
jgi:transcriptional regulator with XRE-family HTH domain